MQWGGAGITQLAANVSASGAKVVLAFNEPDAADQVSQYMLPFRTFLTILIGKHDGDPSRFS
jgi:hypothetical protein